MTAKQQLNKARTRIFSRFHDQIWQDRQAKLICDKWYVVICREFEDRLYRCSTIVELGRVIEDFQIDRQRRDIKFLTGQTDNSNV